MTALIKAGMDVVRLHCSYADQTEHAENIEIIRRAARKLHRKVLILQDLSGTKIRIKALAAESVELKAGAKFTLTSREVRGDVHAASLNFPEIISVTEAGDTVLLADGALKLEVLSVTPANVRCKVIIGGRLKSGQAVHIPGRAVPLRVPTAKDRDDVLFGIRHGVDAIALSYATSAEEMEDLREFVRQQGAGISLVAKIERREALRQIDNLIRAADAMMVARGDLGLEIPLEEIPFAQKDIIRRANAAGKPVITATEMLASMIEQPRPTRAEVTDIANAILDGSDAVMLSGETGVGKYPVKAAAMMAQIAAAADRHLAHSENPRRGPRRAPNFSFA